MKKTKIAKNTRVAKNTMIPKGQAPSPSQRPQPQSQLLMEKQIKRALEEVNDVSNTEHTPLAPTPPKRRRMTPEQALAQRLQRYDFVSFHEHDETLYFKLDALDKTKLEQWLSICAYIVQQRDRYHCYGREAPDRGPEPPPVDPSAPLMTQQEQLNARIRWRDGARQFRERSEEWELLLRARAGDRMAAADLLDARQHHECERFEFHEFSKIDVE